MNLDNVPKFQLQQALANHLGLPERSPEIICLSRQDLITRLEGTDFLSSLRKEGETADMSIYAKRQEMVETINPIAADLDDLSEMVLKLSDRVDSFQAPKEKLIVIDRTDTEEVRRDLGTQHESFETLLTLCRARINTFLVGPAGSGKTTAAKNVADALGVPFYFNGAIESEYKLLGFIDAQGRVVSKPFREAFLNGGVYLFDEVDASLPSAVLAFNAALANGRADFPDGCREAHPDFICIAAGNTFYGADHQYVGRCKQDAAFLDRFSVLEWSYDLVLEENMAKATHEDERLALDWHKMIKLVRKEAASIGLHIIVSPRATVGGLKCMKAGLSWETAVQLNIRKTMKAADWEKIGSYTRRQEEVKKQTREEAFLDNLAATAIRNSHWNQDNESHYANYEAAWVAGNSSIALSMLKKSLSSQHLALTARSEALALEILSEPRNSLTMQRLAGVLRSPKCVKATSTISLKQGLI